MVCSFGFYYWTVFIEFLCSISIVIKNFKITNFALIKSLFLIFFQIIKNNIYLKFNNLI